jgi:hypothetical protein
MWNVPQIDALMDLDCNVFFDEGITGDLTSISS